MSYRSPDQRMTVCDIVEFLLQYPRIVSRESLQLAFERYCWVAEPPKTPDDD